MQHSLPAKEKKREKTFGVFLAFPAGRAYKSSAKLREMLLQNFLATTKNMFVML